MHFIPCLFALVVHIEDSMADVWDSSRDARGVVPTLSKCLIIGN